MQFTDYWQQFEHTGRVEDYLNYLQSAGREDSPAAACGSSSGDCRAEGSTAFRVGEEGSCRNPCM